MKYRFFYSVLLAMAFALTACQSSPQKTAETPVPAPTPEKAPVKMAPAYRGLFKMSGEVSEFRDCDTRKRLWVVDQTGQLDSLYRANRAMENGEVYAILHGNMEERNATERAGGYEATFLVTHVREMEKAVGTAACK